MIFGWAVKKEAGTKHTQMLLLLQIFYGIGPTSEGEKQSTLHDPRLKKKQPTMNGEKNAPNWIRNISRFNRCRLHPSAAALFPSSGTCGE